MTYIDNTRITQQTLQWIRSFVIEYNICPFAKHVLTKGSLSIQVNHATHQVQAMEALISALDLLDNTPTIDTILLIFPDYLLNFFDYLNFVDVADQQLFVKNYEGIYQLATFHPDYCFAGVDENDVTNYTNRSPYPMLHVLRETSIDIAIDHYGNTEGIPEKNIETMRNLGLDKIKQLGLGVTDLLEPIL
jgi:uncharacterized protein